MNNEKPPLGIPILLPLLLFLLLLAMLPFVFGQLFTVALIKLKLDPTRSGNSTGRTLSFTCKVSKSPKRRSITW